MFIQSLYEKALIEPFTNHGAKELFIVSGYSSATFANRHLTDCADLTVNLIIGMPGKKSDHLGYLNLYKKFGGRFKGFYLDSPPPVHSKLYGWFDSEEPIAGYSGSANYSQSGFTYKQQINQLIADDPNQIRDFYESLKSRSTEIPYYIFEGSHHSEAAENAPITSVVPGGIYWIIPNRKVSISFLQSNGEITAKSGLNWGQREGREPNQAYLSIKKEARNEGFLPPKEETFTLITDDNKAFDCVVAQSGRKAIHSTFNNSELGRYIRDRINVKHGDFVTREHLEIYGRTDFTIEKLNSETFLLDLSVKT